MPPASLFVSTRLRPPADLGPDRIVRLASEAGFDGIAAGDDVTLESLKAVAAEALRSGLRIAATSCPLAPVALVKGKRLPWLAAHDDPEERRFAVKCATDTLAFAQQLGVTTFVLNAGPVSLKTSESRLALGYARREMSAEEPGGRIRKHALDERRARGQAVIDALCWSLERLLAEAERRGVRLAIPVAATPWQVPTPREAQQLLREFSGGPLSIVYAPARRELLQEFDLAGPDERWMDLIAASSLVEFSDRVGLVTNLCLGTGELQLALPSLLSSCPSGVVTGPFDSTFGEVIRALQSAREAIDRATATQTAP